MNKLAEIKYSLHKLPADEYYFCTTNRNNKAIFAWFLPENFPTKKLLGISLNSGIYYPRFLITENFIKTFYHLSPEIILKILRKEISIGDARKQISFAVGVWKEMIEVNFGKDWETEELDFTKLGIIGDWENKNEI